MQVSVNEEESKTTTDSLAFYLDLLDAPNFELQQHVYQEVCKSDAEKYKVCKKALDWLNTHSELLKNQQRNEWVDWQVWDNLSILAFYQHDVNVATEAYKVLLKQFAYVPAEHRERIKNNQVYFDLGASDDTTYADCKEQIAKIASLNTSVTSNTSTTSSTSVAHMIYLKGMAFGMHHFIAVCSAAYHMKFKTIFVYNDSAPENNEWWKRIQMIPAVHIVQIKAPNYINKQKIKYKQHQADVIRLLALYEMGGVYLDLDLDMCTFRPFDSVLKKLDEDTQVAMCQEVETRVSNAFIAALPRSPFIKEWIEHYEHGVESGGDWWAGCSVEFPYKLSKKYKCLLLPTATFLPFDYMHTSYFTSNAPLVDFSETFCVHLWDTEQQKRKILPTNVQEFEKSNSMFYQMFKRYVYLSYSDLSKVGEPTIADVYNKLEQILSSLRDN